MQRSRVSLAVCAAAAASLLACGDVAEDSSSVSGATACTVVQNGGGWWNQSFTEQTGRFHVELSATPSARNIDSVVGLGAGSSIYDLTQFPWVTMALHDTTGNVAGYWAEQGWGVGDNGYPGSVKLSPSGRIFFNFDPMPYWTVNRATVPYFAAIDP